MGNPLRPHLFLALNRVDFSNQNESTNSMIQPSQQRKTTQALQLYYIFYVIVPKKVPSKY